jgi:hypothetical protein
MRGNEKHWRVSCSGGCGFAKTVSGVGADLDRAVCEHAACPYPTDIIDLSERRTIEGLRVLPSR